MRPSAHPPQGPTLRSAALAAVTVVVVTAAFAGALVGLGKTVPSVRANIQTVLALSIPLHALLCLGALTVVRRRTGTSWAALGVVRPTWRLLHVLWQIPLALVAVLLTQGIVVLAMGGDDSPLRSSGKSALIAGTPGFAILAAFIGAAILTPLWEEIFFRGFILGALRRRGGAVVAVIGSAAVFALAHALPILLPYLAVMGLCLALLRLFHRSVWGSLALHMTVNTLASTALIAALM